MIGRHALRGLLGRLRASDRGTALIEFCIVLPVTLALYLGGFQLSDAIACNRKVTVTSRAVADLTSQYASVTKGQLDTILGSSAQIMYPYSTNAVLVRVSEVSTDALLRTTVTWSRAINGSPLTPGSAFKLPTNLISANSSMVYAEVSYVYTPMTNFGMVKPVTLRQAIYMLPRVTNAIGCNDCATS